ncbi:MAG: hypothetical protein C4306_06430 [Thermoleophilia bacterium]
MALLAQRALALAGAALLAAVGALAMRGEEGREPAPALPQPALVPGEGWHAERAGVSPAPPPQGRRTACGWTLRPTTLGVVHPVLPCGVKLYVAYGGRQALTRVVAHGPLPPERQLDLTPALARLLGLEGVTEVRWVFARERGGAG